MCRACGWWRTLLALSVSSLLLSLYSVSRRMYSLQLYDILNIGVYFWYTCPGELSLFWMCIYDIRRGRKLHWFA